MRGELLCVPKSVSVKLGGPGSAAHRPYQSFLTFRGERAAPSSVPPAAVARRERRGGCQCPHTHTQSPPSSTDALSLRRDAPEEKDKQSTPALRDTPGPCPRQGASSALPLCGGAAPHPLPALPAVRGTVPQRQESNPAPPPRVWRGAARHSTARLGTDLLTLAIVCAAVPAARGGRRGGCPRC